MKLAHHRRREGRVICYLAAVILAILALVDVVMRDALRAFSIQDGSVHEREREEERDASRL